MASDDEVDEVKQSALFEVEPDWKEHWRGMPEYSHEDLQPWQSIYVHFRTQADRQAFAKLVGQTLSAKTKFIWYPKAEIRRAADKVFTGGGNVTPRYPVYIISKGRWESRLTSKALEWIKVPYHIVVEPQELEQYAAVIDPAKILVTPFSNLGQGGIPARNFVWDHAISTGAERHWILDDNISGFCRFQDNLKVEVDSGATFCAIEDWVDRYENVAMAAFNYDYFAPRKQGAKIKPITLNTRCYSGILLSNKVVHRWRGRYNEDTDLSLRLLKDGHCTALFNAFLMYKKPTLTMKGGNTDELYKGAEAAAAEWEAHSKSCTRCQKCVDGYGGNALPCAEGRTILSKDGRWLMAESLREQHPDCTSVERKWRRWQHQVDYRAFARNELRLRPDVVVDDRPNEYGMELDVMPTGWGAMGHDARNAAWGAQPPAGASLPAASVPPSTGETSALSFVLGQAPPALPSPDSSGQGKASPLAGRPSTAAPTPVGGQPKPASLEPLTPDLPPAEVRLRLQIRGHRLLTRDGRFFVTEPERLTTADVAALGKMDSKALMAVAEPWIETPGIANVCEDRSPDGDERPQAAGGSEGEAERLPDEAQAPIIVATIGSEQAEVKLADGAGSEPADPQPFDVDIARAPSSTSFFDDPQPTQTLAQFLGSEPPRVDSDYRPDEPPDLTGVDEVVLNFATDGVDWAKGHRPGGVTVSTLDGKLVRFLPFRFRGGNLDEEQVKRWAREQLRGKRITNANTRFEVHMAREWGVDLEAQGCTVSDVMHYAALLDDHRKRFGLDVLVADYLPGESTVERLDERDHLGYSAAEAAARERYTAQATARLRNVMWPLLDAEDLQRVRQLEDDVIYPVVEMERNGAVLDLELLAQYEAECKAEHDRIMMEVSAEAGFAFEHTAKGWARLFDKLGLLGSDSYAEDVIGPIQHPLVRKAHYAAQVASLNSKTFAAYKASVGADGVLRYDINQLRGDDGGTVSGRFSIGYVQQVPNHDNHHVVFGEGDPDDCQGALCRWFPRRVFKAAGDFDYLEADAAQIEFRLLVHYSQNAALTQAYKDDPWMSYHKTMQAQLKHYKPDMLYSHTKAYNFAAQYGARTIKLATMMGFITEAEGNEIRQAKRWNDPRLKTIQEIEAAVERAHPEARQLFDRAAHLAKPECDQYCKKGDALHRQYPHRGYVKTLLGRRSRFPTNYKTHIGLNRVIQGTAADVMKRKLVELHRERKETGFLMRLTVHDAVGGDAQQPETLERVRAILNAQSFELQVPILWTVNTGRSWAECK